MEEDRERRGHVDETDPRLVGTEVLTEGDVVLDVGEGDVLAPAVPDGVPPRLK